MNDDEVMELAQRAGTYTEVEDGEEWLVMSESAFPVFAKLIIEAEREKCAQLCERMARPLYTTPPAAPRKWVELTDDEARALVNRATFGDKTNWQALVYMVDAKLKEKNG
jgi:hypothetical protein